MKKWTREDILNFMIEIETSNLSTNEFIWEYMKFKNLAFNDIIVRCDFVNFASTEQISRCRRYVIKTHWIWKRINADKESEYIEEYCLEDKF